MKKILSFFLVAMLLGAGSAHADIKDILGGITGGKKTTETKEQTKTETTGTSSSSSGGGLGGLLEGIQAVGNQLGLIPSKTVDVKYLQGQWDYSKPAVAFKSENFLAKAGGVAASAKVESELEPYYKRFGFDKVVLTVAPDSTFTMKLPLMSFKGDITSNSSDKTLTFHFKVMGLSLTSMTAYVNAETAKRMSITFDVTKLMTLFQKVAAISGKAELKALSSLLNNYEGMTAGFYMTKTAEATAK